MLLHSHTHTHDLMAVSPSKVRHYRRHNYKDPKSPTSSSSSTATTTSNNSPDSSAYATPVFLRQKWTLFVYAETIYIYYIARDHINDLWSKQSRTINNITNNTAITAVRLEIEWSFIIISYFNHYWFCAKIKIKYM